MTQKNSKKTKEKELTPEEQIASLTAQVEFLKGLLNERNAMITQAVETIKAQKETIELLNKSLDAMNKTNELLRKN